MFSLDIVSSRMTRPLDAHETVAAETHLADLVGQLGVLYPNVKLDSLPQNVLRGVESVVAGAIIRWLLNPEGFISESDGSYSYQRASGVGDVHPFFSSYDRMRLDNLLAGDTGGESGFVAIRHVDPPHMLRWRPPWWETL